MPVSKPKLAKINVAIFIAVGGVTEKEVMHIWSKAFKFQDWDLEAFEANPPKAAKVRRVKRIVELSLLNDF